MSFNGQEEEKASSAVFNNTGPSLQSRLYPDHGRGAGLQAKNRASAPLSLKAKSLMSQSTPLMAPVNYDGTASSGSTANATGRKVLPQKAVLATGRTLSTSASAAMLLDPAHRATASRRARGGGAHPGSDDWSDLLPPVPAEHSAAGAHAGKVQFVSFLESLHLSAAQLHSLEHEPHTFFYLRVRQYGPGQDRKGPVAQLRAQAASLALRDIHAEESKGVDEEATRSLEGNMCAAGSVYCLEVVSQDQLDKDHYFTLSKEGVTIYRDKVSQFTPLVQWERETLLFNKIIHIRFFALYKRWKAFTVWRRGLSGGKMDHARERLSSSMFCLCAPLREALLTVRRTSMPMASLGMLSLPAGEIFDVDAFVKTQLAVQADLRGKLDDLSAIVLSSVRAACDAVVDQFLKANNIAANHKMTFMERAALRAECRRLTRFLRMVDIMMTDFLMSMIKDAIDKLAHAAEPHGMKPRIETSDSVDKKAIARKRIEGRLKAPLFRVVVNFRRDALDGEDSMTMSPPQDALMAAINTVITESVDVVCSFVKASSRSIPSLWLSFVFSRTSRATRRILSLMF